MNREIKFRAWHYADQKMYEVSVLDKFNDEEYNRVYLKGKEIKFGDRTNYFADDKMVSLMQFTGLLDKNGKEIYEGDICKFYNKYSQRWFNRVVRYCPMFACFGLYPNMEEIWQYESDWLKIYDVEVLGNIFENPNLLNP